MYSWITLMVENETGIVVQWVKQLPVMLAFQPQFLCFLFSSLLCTQESIRRPRWSSTFWLSAWPRSSYWRHLSGEWTSRWLVSMWHSAFQINKINFQTLKFNYHFLITCFPIVPEKSMTSIKVRGLYCKWSCPNNYLCQNILVQ